MTMDALICQAAFILTVGYCVTPTGATSFKRTRGSLLLRAISSIPLIASAASASPRHVTLQLEWTHQFQFAGYYSALERGYYREAGLDVRIVETKTDAKPAIHPGSG